MPSLRRHLPALVICSLATGYWIWFRLGTGIQLEDALITYRFAENLATGHGFAFNPGEVVLGTTTPLYAMILAVSGALVGVERIPAISVVLSILLGQGAGLLVRAAMLRVGLPRLAANLALVLCLFHPDVVWSTTGGMETALVLFLMSSALLAVASERYGLAGTACGLLVLARVDGVFWSMLILGLVLVLARPRFLRGLACFAAVLLPWIAYALFTFGSPVPNSVAAKRAVVHAGRESVGPLRGMAEHAFWFLETIGVRMAGGPWETIVFAGLFALVPFGALGLAFRRDRAPLLPLALFPFLLGAGYFVGRAPREFAWYGVPSTWCCLPLAVVGAFELHRILTVYRADRPALPRWTALALPALLLAPPLLNLPVGNKHAFYQQREYQENEDGLRRVVGTWLADNTSPGAVVAMEAIGYQGFFSGRRILDLAGLISPAVVTIHRESANAAEAFERILAELSPDVIVLRSFEVDENRSFYGGPLFASDDARRSFEASYREIMRFSAPHPASWGQLASLTVYERVD